MGEDDPSDGSDSGTGSRSRSRYTDLSYARLLTSYEAYELAELARAAVPIGAHEPGPGGTPAAAGAVLADAVRALTAAHRLVEAAVVYERLGGTDPRLIGALLDLPPHTAASWWRPLTRTAPLEAALDLDDWVLRHEDGDDLDTAPVSGGLVRRAPQIRGEDRP
ncbi:hypothetical protein [Streptomyces sp. DSM 40750]|uniref:hypothetical protein n=1 Tax=Streptomyces sp. DSM 40750 TaxID=2801030 RepID=UPI00214C36FF|nr:hypothetical protein [Streptomyces sp. DSM 40750]UUU22936.1 hypothetical protein JIX55_23045 [Streptomyces sp. DSM 40750]